MAILKRQDEVVEARRGVGGGHRGVLINKIPLLRQGATKHVYDLDLFHAFLQRLDLKLCRTGMCMG